MTTEQIDHFEIEAIRQALMGRRIVQVATHNPSEPQWRVDGVYGFAGGRLTLDDGTVLYVYPNEGCGGCSSGWYDIEALQTCDNIITSVDVEVEDTTTPDAYLRDTRYSIFVLAEDKRIEAVTIVGDDGNGYYGTGFRLAVVKA